MVYPETVTHSSINRARRRVTSNYVNRDQRATTKPGHHPTEVLKIWENAYTAKLLAYFYLGYLLHESNKIHYSWR